MGEGTLLSVEKRQRIRRAVEPYAAGLARTGLTPNALTLGGFAISIAAAVLAGLQLWLVAGLVSVLGAAFDMLDGAVARATGRTSRFGAFLDSTFDLWGEGVVFAGVVVGAALAAQPLAALLAALAASSGAMVKYSRAKAESLGWQGEVGLAPRPERVAILGLGLIVAGLSGGPQAGPWLQVALALLFILATITVVQRIAFAQQQSTKE